MNIKLTLRMDETLIRKAKREARRRGKSVSGMTAEYFASLDRMKAAEEDLPPVTKSLVGVLHGRRVSERDYKRHLKEKYL
jgi:hypothetical protein